MKLRFSPSKAAIGYITLSVIALALFAAPLWYGWRANLGTFRAYVPGGEMQRFVEVFQREGAGALAAAVAGQAPNMPADEVLAFAGPAKELLAGNLPAWPHEVPDAPGVYGLAIGLGGEASIRVVVSQVQLPGGYRLLMGRESVRFESLVERFWYGIAAAMLAVLALGAAFAWLLRRSLLREVNEVSRAASAIVQGDLSGRLQMRGGSGELDALAQTVNHMLAQLEQRYALVMNASDEGFWDWNVATGNFYASPRLLEIGGFPAGTTFVSRDDFRERFPFHPEEGAKWRQALDAHFAGNTARLELEAHLLLGREVRWIHLIGLATRDAAGAVVRLTGAMTDVSERKRAEEALRLSEERYALAMEASEEGYVDVNVDTGEFATSERLNEIFGIAPGTRFRGRSDFLNQFRFYGNDGETYRQALRAVEADGGPDRYQFEFRIVLPSGEVRWLWTRGKVTRDAEGRARRRVGVFTDITARKRSEERFALAVAGSNDGLWDWDVLTNEMFLSERAQRIYGLEPGRTIRPRAEWRALVKIHPDDAEGQLRNVEDYLAGKSANYEGEWRVLHPDGRYRWIHIRGTCVRDAEERPTRFAGSVSDVDERRRAEEALRRSESYLTEALRLGRAGSFAYDTRAHKNVHWSPTTYEIFDFDPAGGLPLPEEIYRRVHPQDVERVREARGKAMREKADYDAHYRIVRRDGTVRHLHATGHPVLDANGEVVELVGVVTDVTERKRAEQALRLSEERYARAMEGSDAGHWDWNIVTDEMFISERAREMLALPAGALPERRSELMALVPMHPDDRSAMDEKIAASIRSGVHERDYRVIAGPGEMRWVHSRAKIYRDARGAAVRMTGSLVDITERKLAADALRASEERYSLAMEASAEGHFDWNVRTDDIFVSAHIKKVFGFPLDAEFRTRNDLTARIPYHPDDAPWLVTMARDTLAGNALAHEFEYRIVRGDEVHWLQARWKIFRDGDGAALRVVGVVTDITDRKRAEHDLKAMERKLRQAQRLEAMGTLAGGIAHDFNNILGAILGFGEMALRDVPKHSRLHRDVESIITAGERGRALVDRVLAFSRSGVAERTAVHVEKVVREALDLVSAKLPPSVTLHAKLHAGTAAMLGDATQVHQVLMNLATNAVQAMPDGGRLGVSLDAVHIDIPHVPTIGTLAKGNYIVLRVADTGTGIAPDIIERIFDPFFTTKEVGTGTGLGLSLVHGIVTEVGGAIDVTSTVGAGSTLAVYLPHSGEAQKQQDPEQIALPRGGGQRVLIVDDEEPLVTLATRTLSELGYAPVGFTSSSQALAAFRADPACFDAVLADERMPGMSGSALIREMRGIRDRIPIVLMSGHVSAALATRARNAGAEEILKKPLSARDLAASLARVLGS